MSKTKEIVLIGIFSALLFIQEQLLVSLPNIQLTVFLIILYSKSFGYKKTSLIILIYVLLDNFFIGTFNFIYFPFMLIGWSLIPIGLHTIFKKVENSTHLACLSILFSLLYSWIYIIPNSIYYNLNPFVYFISDIPFEIILCISSFITTLWLYEPCIKVLRQLIKKG